MALLDSTTDVARKQCKRVRDEHGIRVKTTVGKNTARYFIEVAVTRQEVVPRLDLAADGVAAKRDGGKPERDEVQPS